MKTSDCIKIFLFFVFLCGVIRGESPVDHPAVPIYNSIDPTGQATALLESDDIRKVAWGAWFASEHRLAETLPIIRRRWLELSEKENSEEADAVLRVLFDAYFQISNGTDQTFADALIKRGWITEFLLLASRSPEDYRLQLLGIDDADCDDYQFMARLNLLAEYPTAAVCDAIIKKTVVTIQLNIVDEEDTLLGGPRPGSMRRITKDKSDEHSSPIPYYVLHSRPSRGDVVLATGPKLIYYQRNIGRKISEKLNSPFDRNVYRGSCLMHILQKANYALHISTNVAQHIPWKGKKDLLLKGANVKLKTIKEWKQFVQELHQRELLSDPQTVQPTFELLVNDHRANKTDINSQITAIEAVSLNDPIDFNNTQEDDNAPDNIAPAASPDYDF